MSPDLGAGTRWLQATGRLPSVVTADLASGRVESLGAEADTQYRIGSITKTLTAVLVLQLRDEGRLDLEDPIGHHVPETGYGHLSVAQLLSHTGGMQSEPVGPWWERNPGVDLATLLSANDGSGAVAPPPSWFHYSNLGFALLGEAVARLRSQPWWEAVRTRLLEPLGMTRTSYHPQTPHAQGYGVGHFSGVLVEEPHHDTGAMAPAGQAWSAVGDLVTWAGFLAAGHPDVLARETLLEMGAAALSPGYGLGLRRIEVGGRTMVGHTGSMPGFLASLFVDQATGEGTVLLTNATTGILADEVPSVLLGPRLAAAVEPWVPTPEVPQAIEPLLGVWFWEQAAYELRWHNQTLHLRNLATGRLSDVFAPADDGRLVGTEGYHRGETLHVHPDHLECATFVYRRTPR